MKYFVLFFMLGIVIIILSGCSAGEIVSRNYYILEYYEHTEMENLKLEEPFDYSVMVLTTHIPQTYNKRQIVLRHFGPRITYSDNDIWGVKLSEIIPTLITKRLSRYNIFKHVQQDFFEEPDYVVTTSLNNIELYETELLRLARLNIDFYLSKDEEEASIVRYSVNIEKVLPDEEIETFVQTVNEMILGECDKFIIKIINHFSEKPIYEEYLYTYEEGFDSTLIEIPDEEIISEGKGLLLLPAITRSDNEPYYKIFDKYGYEISGKMGVPVPLMKGTYSIRYGSGNEDQMMKKTNIEIVPRYKKIVEPDWGCLIVDIIDEKRNFANVQYELFDAENGESYGFAFPADEEIGELEKIWVLNPGLYKLTINNEPFNTYRDFTTVFVEVNKVQKLTIVVDTDEEGNPTNLIGSGILEKISLEALLAKLKFSSAIHANVNFNSDNEDDKDKQETTITLNTQLDNRLIYDYDPFHYTMKNLIEIGTTKGTDTDFRISADEIDFKNTLIYYFMKNVGFYSRFDANSHFFTENYYSPKDFFYTKIDKSGDIVEEEKLDDEVQVKSSLFPIILKEGLGINYRILNYSRANLSLRAGFGLRQDFNNNVYELAETYTDTLDDVEHRTYKEQESTDKTGTEVSVVGNFQLPFGLTYSTNADFLFPFNKDETTVMEWENSINLRLFKYISIDYKLKLENKKPEIGDEYIVEKHTLFLRITYFLR